MGSFYQNNWRWDLKWRRHLFEHEEGVAVAFMEEISAYPIQCHLKDNLLWKADPTGMYSTRSAYRLLSNLNSFAPDGRNFQLIWKLKIPPKAAIFTWRLIKDRLPTRANLHRRNVGTCGGLWLIWGVFVCWWGLVMGLYVFFGRLAA